MNFLCIIMTIHNPAELILIGRKQMFGFLFNKKKLNNSAHKLFSKIIEQSRIVHFYETLKVDDNLDGRFDLMSLHMALILEKLDQYKDTKNVPEFKRNLQEIMFDNLDLTLREIGVGDLGVGKKIKVMAEAFYGRMMAYQNNLITGNEQEMLETLKRNLYRNKMVDEDVLQLMTAYVFEQYNYVNVQEINSILEGQIEFQAPVK